MYASWLFQMRAELCAIHNCSNANFTINKHPSLASHNLLMLFMTDKQHWAIPDEIHTPLMEGIILIFITGSADFKRIYQNGELF